MSSFFGGGASNVGGGNQTGTAAAANPFAGKNMLEGLIPASSAANTNTGKSLFDRVTPAASSAANTGGLFGAAPATSAPGGSQPAQTSSGGGLFGGLGATSQAASTGGGLFGGAPSTGAGLFGGALGATNQPATTSSGSNLFGGLNATSKPAASNSLFGATTQPPQQQPAQVASGSLFGSSMQPAQNQDTGMVRAQDSNAPPPNPSYFAQLLERGKKRQTEDHINAFGDLPQLELGLADISRKVRKLGQGGPSAGLAKDSDYTKAHYLLSASGVNTSKALRDLEKLTDDTRPTYDRELSQGDGFKRDLARRYQDDFQEMVDGHIRSAHDDFNKMVNEQLHGVDWAAHRQRIYEHFGLKKPQGLDSGSPALNESGAFGRSRKSRVLGASANGRSFGLPGMTRSVIGTPGPKGAAQSQFADVAERLSSSDGFRTAPEDRIARMRQDKYAELVKDLNVARLQERPYPVLQRFSGVESDQPGEDTSMLTNAFQALIQMVGEDPSKDNNADPGAIRERHYAKDYLDDGPNAKGQLVIRKRVINGARSFLENLFFSQLDAAVTKNPREANVGGVPTPVAKVKGYVRVRAARRELGPDVEILQELDGDYCWAVIFYLLRSGLVKEALTYVDENANAFRHIDRKFMGYIKHYAESEERRLPQRDQTDIHNDYSQRTKLAPEDSIDPYRMMCYKVVGRCDLARRTIDTINSDMMDFLWLQFALAREYNRVDEFAHEAFGLDEIRSTIKDIGERYFGPKSEIPNAPTTFFFMEMLAGMFEKAVADLYPQNPVSATHFAIALAYYGLLRVSDITFSDDLLSYTTRQQSQIAFGSMVGLYTRDFRTANPTSAVDYLAIICLNADLPGELGRAQRELCHQALTELVLETREFAQLLGDIRADGQRIKGAIEQRLKLIGLENEQEFLRAITTSAARVAEDNSRTTDAALLYHLAEDYDKVVTIVNDAVSIALTTELGEALQKLEPLKPRTGANGEEVPRELQGSLSLTAVDDPIELARNFRSLYGSSQMYYGTIGDLHRDSCNLLLHLSDARRAIEGAMWPTAVDVSSRP